MVLCCLVNYLTGFGILLVSGWASTVLFTSVIWIPGFIGLVYLFGAWIRSRKRKLLPHISGTTADGERPVTVGFFHPYCDAGGGGERVLWIAIRALQNKYKNVKCVVYTGDTDVSRERILQKARQRFNLSLPRDGRTDFEFVFLHKRHWVESASYPHFTLLGQSVGSMVLGMEALLKFVPDVYIDTMGYAFTLPLFKYLGGASVGCYVHYPTISTDMLEKVSNRTAGFNNSSRISRSPFLSRCKLIYYKLFACAYGVFGRRSDVIMVNSTWTRDHILQLWRAPERTTIVYPPCDTREFLSLPLVADSERSGVRTVVSVAQFRPEKDHLLQIRAFHHFLTHSTVTTETGSSKEGSSSSSSSSSSKDTKLVLVGSCRNADDLARVEALRARAHSIGLTEDQVEFKLNVSFGELKQLLNEAIIGLHTMRDEHFGIGVVEMMAAGAVTLAHNSAGPKMDIVTDYEGHPTGYLASDCESFAEKMSEIFSLSSEERMSVRRNARASAHRFSEESFESGFLTSATMLINLIK